MAASSPQLANRPQQAVNLQLITLAWLVAELGVSAYAARTAHSVAILAFGSDSLVELLSAVLVLLQWTPALRVPERTAAHVAGTLLYLLAAVICVLAICALLFHMHAAETRAGMAITIAALVVMPALAALKRHEARRTGNNALAADAVQSATCAYIAAITLAGLGLNAAFHLPWFDSVAALAAIPLLLKEARAARKGDSCCCC